MTRGSHSSTSLPDWWAWDLELTPHLEQRMEERDFNEINVREMLEAAIGFRPDVVDGRFIVDGRLRGRRWHVIVEPDADEKLLVVVTAYRAG